ncbi:cupredoxin domain-containing protein [Haladaptatus sp. NG-SE-30]
MKFAPTDEHRRPNRRQLLTGGALSTVGWLTGCLDGGSTGSEPTTDSSKSVTVEGSEWKLEPAEIQAKKGEELTITFENVGTVAHNLTVGTFDVKTETIQPDQTDGVSFTPDQTGEFPYWCDVAGHREAGMKGTLVVE